ncbi:MULTISPECIES: heme exporter protein CcmD [unclassified Halomonas]|uniref:heme exporter protein CcmD n=1 Tax=unclassified Halomonas TaxID=2609666 RepID=UPI0006DB0390|nr:MULTISPECIES: heme exporter protein CcmD [unclassified Halomonas]KPQ29522.1 MAG: ABC-type heme export system heme releasing component CcmD [Halomonas sp. HL-93]SBR50941.1 heme exporter protein D [Halomonas sp. HL-93]SNY97116.1 heme exporter protein D [Halomonas sp. hl-4]
MVFASLADWASMGGHGLYVWSAWGVTAVFMLGLMLYARVERQRLLKHLKRQARRRSTTTQQRGYCDDPKA